MSSWLGFIWGARFLAQTYGAGPYGSLTYGNGVIQIGPITLPDTGATWAELFFIALIAIGVGLYVWLRQRGKRAKFAADQN